MFVPHPSLGHWEKKFLVPKKLMKLTVLHPHKRVAKKYWRLFMSNLLPTSLKSTWIFYFWDILLGLHSIWMLLLLLWMQLWLNMLRFVCGFLIFYIMNFNKVDKSLCFRRKVTSQGLIKKMFLGRSR